MYIHSYQIHNVLNEYRKQLSRDQAMTKKNPSEGTETKDRVILSDEVQRQSIIEQVSSDIVARIQNTNCHQSTVRDELDDTQGVGNRHPQRLKRENEFTYTLIDEFNRKIITKLPVQNLKPLSGFPKQAEEQANNLTKDETIMEKRSLGIG